MTTQPNYATLLQAADAVVDAGFATRQLIQDTLGVGWRRATAVLDALHALNVIGPPADNPAGQRAVLIPDRKVWDEIRNDYFDPDGTPAPTATAAAAAEGLEYVEVDPNALLVDLNIRDTRVDVTLRESVADFGVLVPIRAVRTPEGQLRVRLGHRRTLAAIETGRPTVPVLVAGDEDDDELQRITEQWAENEHRQGFTTAEHVATVQQIAAFGLPAREISRRLHAPRVDVERALTVGSSPRAREQLDTRPDLTLDQAAGLADAETWATPEVLDQLVQVLDDAGEFAHRLQYARDEHDRETRRQEIIDGLRDRGITILDEHPSWDGRKTRQLRYLFDAKGKPLAASWDNDPGDHATCPGHAAHVTTNNIVMFACADWPANDHHGERATDTSSSRSTPAPPKPERAEVIERNKQWTSATTVRRAWLTELLGAAALDKKTGAAAFIAGELARGDLLRTKFAINGTPLVHDLLGMTNHSAVRDAAAAAKPARAEVIALGIVLAYAEAAAGTHSWRDVNPQTKRYLEFLEADGYTLSEVEHLAAGHKLKANKNGNGGRA